MSGSKFGEWLEISNFNLLMNPKLNKREKNYRQKGKRESFRGVCSLFFFFQERINSFKRKRNDKELFT